MAGNATLKDRACCCAAISASVLSTRTINATTISWHIVQGHLYQVLPGKGLRSKCDTPSKVVQNDKATLGPPDTDKQVMVQQLNIVVLDKKAPVIDVAVPNDSNISNEELKDSSC